MTIFKIDRVSSENLEKSNKKISGLSYELRKSNRLKKNESKKTSEK